MRCDLLSARALRPLGAGVLLVAASVMLAGCGGGLNPFKSKKAEQPVGDSRPPEVIYGEAETLLNEQDWKDAAKKYEDVDVNHPYSTEARRAIVMSAYAYYKNGKYPEAISAGKRYLTLHPGTDEAPLAQNIIAMAYYDQVLDPKRDQTNARESLNAYETLVQRYPTSRYSAEARNRILILRNLLAANSMTIGRYYLRDHDYLAAINRFRDVVTEYQQTEQVEEALMRLTEAYLALGIVNEAETAAAVLGHNFPNSKWYQKSYSLLQKAGRSPHEHAGSWITQTFRGEGNPA
ncbi:outer membrane protein assembly factor BamD [Methyloligella solikamskensis]|uniref:Outer membrane protein assembly factor BamD n=1 Tax=Methyloligella solikamskensis TaxID=1177756 RepID=A0ABW3JBP3_9HYPH